MNAKEKLKKVANLINDTIEKELNTVFGDVGSISPEIEEMVDHIKNISKGGKRLRGSFVYFSYLMFGGKDREEILKVAAFVELIHTHILMADDVIDEDDFRRGVPTLHKVYKDIHKERFCKKDPVHFGNSMAICGSLITDYAVQQIVLKSKFPPDRILRALVDYYDKMVLTGYGEALDVLAEVHEEVTEEEAMQINLLKTANYTYESPLHVGAILAGASDDDLKVLSEYAIPGGIAFQIQDDILGMFGDEEKLGKPSDSDLKEGKQNILTLKTIEMASDGDRKRFLELLGNKDITEEEVKEARDIIERSGAREYARNLAIDYVQKSLKAIESFEGGEEGLEFLRGVAEYMINREV